jgi:hypothetical protein
MAPFILTRQVVRIAMGQVFPGNSLSIGDAALSLSGALTLRNVALWDTGAQRPLVAVREVDAAFNWAELVSRRIRKIDVRGVTVYAGADIKSQIGLLDLYYQRFRPNQPSKSNSRPLWIDALNVQGNIQAELVNSIVLANTDWPLTLQMTMSGDRMEPSRQFRVAIGETRGLPEKIQAPAVVANTRLRSAGSRRDTAGGRGNASDCAPSHSEAGGHCDRSRGPASLCGRASVATSRSNRDASPDPLSFG